MKFEVMVTVWDEEQKKRVKKVAGTFDKFFNAKLFADAYANHFQATCEIVEWIRK